MDSKKARKLKEGFLVKKVGKLPVNFLRHTNGATLLRIERQSHSGFRSMKKLK